jgi:hypothetical protein
MKRTGILAVAAVLLVISLPLASQEAAGTGGFEQTLYQLLQKRGWSPEKIQNLLDGEVDWERSRFQDAEMLATCLDYAQGIEGEIGPEAQLRLALELMILAQEMRSLGFGEPQIIRAALNGTRDALGELERLRETEHLRTGEGTAVGELIQSRFQEQLQAAMHLEARHMVQARAQEEQNSRPGDLLVPPGPQGPGGPGH